MPTLFGGPHIVFLDSSAIVWKPFSQELKDALAAEKKLFVSCTYESELKQYMKLISVKRCSYFLNNQRYLSGLSAKTIPSPRYADEDEDARAGKYFGDIWGSILYVREKLSSLNIIVVTANVLLMHRIILHNLSNVDIYDVNQESLLQSSEYSSLAKKIEYRANAEPPLLTPDRLARKGTVLFRQDGASITLSDALGSTTGAEAQVFRVDGQRDHIVKVYKNGKFSREKYDSVSYLISHRIYEDCEAQWAIFPETVVYYDEKATIPAGLLERCVEAKDLGHYYLYCGDEMILLEDEWAEESAVRLSENIERCLSIVRQVYYLNTCGFLVSDFNLNNFALSGEKSFRHIIMFDTDSFGYDTFFGNYCACEGNTRAFDVWNSKAEAIDFCNEALFIGVFSILSLGDSRPIDEETRQFTYSRMDDRENVKKRIIPAPLWSLFQRVFTKEKLFSVEFLLTCLDETLQDLQTHPEKDRTYGEMLSEILRESIEAERLRKQAEAERLRKQAEAERLRRQAEAERLRKQAEAAAEELKRKQAEAERLRKQAEAAAEELKRKQVEAEERKRQEAKKKKEKTLTGLLLFLVVLVTIFFGAVAIIAGSVFHTILTIAGAVGAVFILLELLDIEI